MRGEQWGRVQRGKGAEGGCVEDGWGVPLRFDQDQVLVKTEGAVEVLDLKV